MNGHVFVDETKSRGYVMVASVVPSTDLDALRKVLRGLVLPGQRRLHMKAESDSRRRTIASAIVAAEVEASIYDAGRDYGTEREARGFCLNAIVADAARRSDAIVVLEQDDTLVEADRRILYRATRDVGCAQMRYEHRRASGEELLALPDAIAWCWARGGDWRRRVQPVITDVRQV